MGLLARFHTMLIAVVCVGAISVGSAIFLILDLGNPYHGITRLSDAPARTALAQLAR
jgi:hypothetical protein